MMRPPMWFSRAALITGAIAPLGIMGLLTVRVLLPNLQNPESRFYSSFVNYQRLAGRPIAVEAIPVVQASMEAGLAAPGESVALQQVAVRSLISGPVEKVYVTEGAFVRRGEPLVALQRAPFEDKVNEARNHLAIATAKLESLEISTQSRLQELEANAIAARSRLTNADTRLQEINTLAEAEIQTNVAAAQQRLETARKRLSQIQGLVDQGALPQFQLYDAQDAYALRQKELLAAQQGAIDTQDQRFGNRDFYLLRQEELQASQQALALFRETADKELENARLAVENRQLELQNATRDLNRTTIHAQTDGLVSRVNINSGELVNAGDSQPLLLLTQDMVFRAFIDQARLNAVNVGDLANVRLVAYPGRVFTGRVLRVNPTVETDETQPNKVGIDRQYTYSAWVAVEDLQMPPGLQGFVEFSQGKTELVVPENSVTHLSGGEGLVLVEEQGKAVTRKVVLGRSAQGKREILEGLILGEKVIANPRSINPGEAVVVREPRTGRELAERNQ
ncbi:MULTISPECIES: efflux RND transporter periplasmic adaptor subunit [Desertifilum]|nr:MULTISPECIES: efflux RND transporter periplasmic adaptor subunit [Desertifilum]